MGAIRDAARTRKRIVQAARQEFAARGFAGARIDAIAKRAKIKKQLLYHYYASKAALFDERNAIIAKQFHGRLPKAFKAELLQLALYALATYPLAYAPITRMVTGKLPSDPKFQQEWMAFLDQLGTLLAKADTDG